MDNGRVFRPGLALLTLLSFLASDAWARPPWPARKRRTEDGLRPGLHQLKNPARWPAEPPSPDTVDPSAFASALTFLCEGSITARRARALANAVLSAAAEARVDPFLLGALAYRQSRCNPLLESPFGVGVLQIQPGMIAGNLRGGRLVYQIREGDAWREKARPVPPGALARLKDLNSNLRLGAAMLGMWSDQHPALDEAFPANVPHRGPAAHFGWGDVVRGSGGEDRALTARRRLLYRYQGVRGFVQPTALGFSVVSPLGGEPRVATSGLGEDREDGARAHRGIDLDATGGEPVASIADGVVTFAGFDLPGQEKPRVVLPEDLRTARPPLGPGGIFVCIRHVPRVVSCYMHLSTFSVRVNDPVKAGQVFGTVGKTGTKVSGAHLHLEIHQDGKAIDPIPVFGPTLVIPPHETLAHDFAIESQKHRLKMERRARRKARMAERAARLENGS